MPGPVVVYVPSATGTMPQAQRMRYIVWEMLLLVQTSGGVPPSSRRIRTLHFFVCGMGTTSFHAVFRVVLVPTHHDTPCIPFTARSEHFPRHPPGGSDRTTRTPITPCFGKPKMMIALEWPIYKIKHCSCLLDACLMLA